MYDTQCHAFNSTPMMFAERYLGIITPRWLLTCIPYHPCLLISGGTKVIPSSRFDATSPTPLSPPKLPPQGIGPVLIAPFKTY